MTAPTIRTLLADAIRRTNVRYNEIPAGRRPKVRWEAADDALEAALKAPDRQRAIAAIEDWETHWRSIFEAVAR